MYFRPCFVYGGHSLPATMSTLTIEPKKQQLLNILSSASFPHTAYHLQDNKDGFVFYNNFNYTKYVSFAPESPQILEQFMENFFNEEP